MHASVTFAVILCIPKDLHTLIFHSIHTLRHRQNWGDFADMFKLIVLYEECILITFQYSLFMWAQLDGLLQERSNSSANALELLSSCTNPWNWQYDPFDSGNGLVLNKGHAITWTYDDPVHWCICCSQDLNVFDTNFYFKKVFFLCLVLCKNVKNPLIPNAEITNTAILVSKQLNSVIWSYDPSVHVEL